MNNDKNNDKKACKPASKSAIYGRYRNRKAISRKVNMPLLGPKYKPIVGLDIGTSMVHAMEIRPSGATWKLHKWHQAPLPPTFLGDGKIKKSDEAVQFIKNFHKEGKFSTNKVALSVGGPSIICKKILVDKMTEMDLEDQISLEAEEYIPFDLEEVFLDFQILGDADDKMAVLLTACKKDFVNDKLEICRQAGLTPTVLDLDVFCLANALSAFEPTPKAAKKSFLWKKNKQKNTSPMPNTANINHIPPTTGSNKADTSKESTDRIIAVVNIGSQNMNTIILVGNTIDYTRDLAFGAKSMISDIMEQTGLSQDETQKSLQHPPDQSTPAPLQDAWETIVKPFEEKLAQQIRQSLDYFQSTRLHKEQPQQILLCGGGAAIAGIHLRIGQFLSLPVEVFNPILKLKRGLGQKGPVSEQASGFTVSLGLALRGVS